MELTRDEVTKLAYAADEWSYPRHEITATCGSCGAIISSTGSVGLNPNWDPFVSWEEGDRDDAIRWKGQHTTFTCLDCGVSWTVHYADALRAALLALGTPEMEHGLHLYPRRVQLTLGKDLPRPLEETRDFIAGLPPAPPLP